MADADRLVGVVESIYAAGVDNTLWPAALLAAARFTGSLAGTLEVFNKAPVAMYDFRMGGLPPLAEMAYLDHYAQHNPRAHYAFRHLSQRFLTDYDVIDERGMDREPYYAKYLRSIDLRYFLSAQLFNTPHQQAVVTIQRTRREGHVNGADVERMQRLLPHFRRSYDMAARLGKLGGAGAAELALEWLADGVALLGSDGTVRHVNSALMDIAAAGDGVGLTLHRIELAGVAERAQLDSALKAASHMRGHGADMSTDFSVARPSGAPPYVISVRPLVRGAGRFDAAASLIVFVRDPLARHAADLRVMQATFGLTGAEADLAHALQAGMSPAQYGRDRGVSANTVYTHLRRIKEKTGTSRITELIHKLNGTRLPLRDD